MGLNKAKQRERNFGGILAVFAFCFALSSCAKDRGYTIVLADGASSTYQYAEAYHEGSLALYSGTDKIADVTPAMLVGFSTSVTSFDQDLPLGVSYQGFTYKTTYQVSSLYTFDQSHYTVKIGANELNVSFIGSPDGTAQEFSLPSSIATLPGVLKTYPVTTWSASFGAMLSLEKVTLSPVVKSFVPEAIAPAIAVYPSSTLPGGQTGVLDYQGDFLIQDSVLWGIRSGVTGELVLPTGASSFKANAFAATLSGVTSLRIPSSYSDCDFSALSRSLPNNQAFILDQAPKGYSTSEGFILYSDGSDTFIRGIPLGRFQNKSDLTLPSGVTRFLFSTLDDWPSPSFTNVIFPAELTSFSVPTASKATYLTSLQFTSTTVVRTNAISIKNLPSSLTAIMVPSALLDSYKNDTYWSKVASLFIA
jgi:hypothetical protein